MTGTDIVAFKAKLQEQAVQAAAEEPQSSATFLSARGGILAFGEEELPGNQVCVIILDALKENTLYAEKFDEDNPQPPTCYAFGRGNDEMGPHPSMQVDLTYFQPQNDTCEGCQHNEWGSADKGRGKACQNRRRLALIPAGFYSPKRGSRDYELELFTDEKHFASADIAFLKLPVTSVKDWAKYVTQLSATVHLPPHGVVTRIFIEPDAKTQYKIHFEMVENVPDELLAVVMARHDEATAIKIQGYAPPREPEPQKQGSLRGLRRGR